MNRFDEVSKALATSGPRRAFLKLLAAGPLAGLAARLGWHETAAAQGQTLPPAEACCNVLLTMSDYILINHTRVANPNCFDPVTHQPLPCRDAYKRCLMYYGEHHICPVTACSGTPTCLPGSCGAPGSMCSCVTTVDQGQQCVALHLNVNSTQIPFPCTNPQSCMSSHDCPQGWVCSQQVATCCGNSEFPICVPLCTTPIEVVG